MKRRGDREDPRRDAVALATTWRARRDGDWRESERRAPEGVTVALLLWTEYMFGGPGRKPAKDFSPRERGAVKHVYCFRKNFWDKCLELVNSGFTATAACDRIYEACGPLLPACVRNFAEDESSQALWRLAWFNRGSS